MTKQTTKPNNGKMTERAAVLYTDLRKRILAPEGLMSEVRTVNDAWFVIGAHPALYLGVPYILALGITKLHERCPNVFEELAQALNYELWHLEFHGWLIQRNEALTPVLQDMFDPPLGIGEFHQISTFISRLIASINSEKFLDDAELCGGMYAFKAITALHLELTEQLVRWLHETVSDPAKKPFKGSILEEYFDLDRELARRYEKPLERLAHAICVDLNDDNLTAFETGFSKVMDIRMKWWSEVIENLPLPPSNQ